ncbi:MAG: toll/interleukin-1 receptor domain-containing protein [Rhodomicrobium sp.]
MSAIDLRNRDIVDISVFSIPELQVGEQQLIQVFLHLKQDILRAARLACETNSESNRIASSTLDAAIARGEVVELLLESKFLLIDKAFQELAWNGEPTNADFFVKVSPKNSEDTISATLIVGVGGIAIGQIHFTLPLSNPKKRDSMHTNENQHTPLGLGFALLESTAAAGHSKTLVDGVVHKYRYAFISYSRKDFKEVSLFAQGLSEHNIELFFDVSSIEPGVEWAKEIMTSIPKADTFYLMWSENAAKSEWVIQESQIAAELYDSTKPPRPCIKPITISRGAPQPPVFLAKFHFDSKFLALRSAEERPLFK